MPRYFNYFPKTLYGYQEGSADAVTNLTAKAKFEDKFMDTSVAFYEYTVSDGQTPELIAGEIYDDTEKHWSILMVNDVINPQNDWLMDQKSLTLYIDKKYRDRANLSNNETGLEWAQENNHSYYKIETQTNKTYDTKVVTKIEIDQNTFANLTSSTTDYVLNNGDKISVRIEKEQKSYFDYEVEENEKKRSIKILKREVVSVLDTELKRVFSL